MSEWLNVLVRSVGIFFIVLFIARIMGKRLTSRMTFFDLVTAIVIGVMAAVISLNLVNVLANGLIAMAVWVVALVGIYFLSIKFKIIRDIVQGKETVLINHGKVLEDKLMEVRYTPEDLLSQLRKKNVFNFADVEFAVMEPSGDVSVLLKKDKQPLTAKAMGFAVGHESVPQTVMLDGLMLDEPLTAMGLNRHWLHTELEKVGVAPENVSIAQVDSVGQLYLDLFNDAIITPKPKTKDLLFATLKKCQADCELYALGTKHQKSKKIYEESALELAGAVQELEPVLKR